MKPNLRTAEENRFRKWIKSKQTFRNLKNSDMAVKMHMPYRTWNYRISHPASFRWDELRRLEQVLKVSIFANEEERR